MLQGFHKKHLQTKRGSIGHILVLLNVEKRSIALDNIEKIADALEIDAYLLFVNNPDDNEKI